MIKSIAYRQINIKNQTIVLNAYDREVEINNEAGFILLPAIGINPYLYLQPNLQSGQSKNIKVEAYKAAPDSGNQFAASSGAFLAATLIPGLGLLAHLFEGVNAIREFSENVLEDAGRKVVVIQGALDNSININPRDSLNPNVAFLPTTPFSLSMKPEIEFWKQKRIKKDEENEEVKKLKKGL